MTKDVEPKTRSAGGEGVFDKISIYIKLILRLFADRRVNPFLKLLPIISLIYLPMPDLLPGPFDDTFLLALGLYLFIELSPKEVVKEHMDYLTNVVEGEWREIDE
ncbi:MAG: hypothetical protein GTO18_05810 [Anaerolineales bacterium]|nr:hypothetical protein [Anaerolineales bacterium]